MTLSTSHSDLKTPSTAVTFADSTTALPAIPEELASSNTSVTMCDMEEARNVPVEEWKPERKEWFIMVSLAIISLMVALDATILVTVLPQIALSLNGTSIDAFWAGTSYLLSSAIFQPVIASISQFFGRQQLLLVSLTLFTVGTILCAAAKNFTVMLAGRTIQGIGGGGIITLSQVIFCDIVPLRFRPKYFALVLGAWSVGTIAGPVIGGVFVEKANWRWAFIINFPFCLLGFLLAIYFVRLNAVSKISMSQKIKSIDWFGAFLFLGSTTALLVGISWGGVQYAWVSSQTLAPIMAGVLGVVAFVGWQVYSKPRSLLPMSIFYCPSALLAFYCALANGLILFTFLYYIPFYCMSVRGSSPTRAGIDVFPAAFLLVPGSLVVSILTTRLGRFRWALWAGWTITTLGSGLLLLLDLHTSYAILAIILAVFGIGSGMIVTSINVAVQAISKVEDSAMASCLYAFMRSLGMPLGVAISGTVFTNAMSGKLASYNLPETIAHDSERYIYVLRTMAADDEKRTLILESYLHGFRAVFMLMMSVAASALVASLFIQGFNMNKKLHSQFTTRFPAKETKSKASSVQE
ncbi:MFS general substrate transporter [Byssothecium circinans]|uniref:MFS general substrate transporter n=1 Tax=Byssothecium circinans TaxID=147558 RepID=A0A6A5U7H6_9PLEO|nr:MFS general substrate transporter [Byssothecium circinans]